MILNMALVLAFAGSNSSTSINFKLVRHSCSLIEGHVIQLKDMAQYPFPMYRADDEKQFGVPPQVRDFGAEIQAAQGIVLSVNEHNGNPSAYFKNLMDWLSRMDRKFMEGTKVLLLSASGGKRGGKGSLEVSLDLLQRFGAEVVSSFSLPRFHENLGDGGIVDPALRDEHQRALQDFLDSIT